jgi:hypothetical protein
MRCGRADIAAHPNLGQDESETSSDVANLTGGGVGRELTGGVKLVLRSETAKFTSASGEEAKERGNVAFKEGR